MKVICVDDEYLALEFIKQQLKKIKAISSIHTFQQSVNVLEYMKENPVDVVFLDINMPGIGGMELAELITKSHPNTSIVFITAYQHYAVDAFHLNAVDYLVKPIKFNRLEDTIQRVKDKLNRGNKAIQLPTLRIRMMGYLAFKKHQKEFQIKHWRTKKAEELFLLLLQYHDKVVSKYDIKSIIWNDIDKGDAILHTTIYNIRKNIKDYSAFIKIIRTTEGYLLQLTNVEIDVELWEQKTRRLSNISQHNYHNYESLILENHAPYLNQNDSIWIESERERLEKIWSHLATSLAQFAMSENKTDLAQKVYNLLIERYPYEQSMYLILMKIYFQNNQIDQVKRIHNMLIDRLKLTEEEELDKEIEHWMLKNI